MKGHGFDTQVLWAPNALPGVCSSFLLNKQTSKTCLVIGGFLREKGSSISSTKNDDFHLLPFSQFVPENTSKSIFFVIEENINPMRGGHSILLSEGNQEENQGLPRCLKVGRSGSLRKKRNAFPWGNSYHCFSSRKRLSNMTQDV